MKISLSKFTAKRFNKLLCFVFLQAFMLLGMHAIAQPPNNLPCNATSLTVNSTCTSFSTFDNTAATNSGVANPGCGSYNGADVWFSVTVPPGGALNFITQAGTITDAAMAIYSGPNCNSLSLVVCNDDATGTMPLIRRTGLAVGSTVWIRVWDYGGNDFGTFGICVSVPPPPPINDNPCNAIFLSPTPLCNYSTFSNDGATTTASVFPPACGNFLGGDIWFKTIVPCSGALMIDTQTGVVTDGAMAVYTGNCAGTLTLVECDDDDSPNGLMPMLNINSLNPGDTVLIRFWERGNDVFGTFGICVAEGVPQGSGNNCNTASPFCTGTNYNFPNNTGVPSLGGGGVYGCLATTPNPVWYYMQIQNPGTIAITINQTSATTGAGIDVDFALWGPFNNLASACNGISATNIVDCSYSAAPTEVVDIPNAVAGQFYMMLITNFSNQPGNITFSQTGGNASTSCAVICNVTASNTGPVCSGGSFSLSASDITNATYSWTGPDCFTSSLQNPTNITAPTTPGTYTYTVLVTTPSGSFCQKTTTVTVTNAVSGTATTTRPACAATSDGSITVNTSVPGNYTYTLNPGNISQVNNPLFSNLAGGTYSVSFTNNSGCTAVINNIFVLPFSGLTGTSTRTAPTCLGATDGTVTIVPDVAGNYNYTLNPGNITQVNNPVFNGLAAGTYSATFTNAVGCSGTINGITVANGIPISGNAVSDSTTCPTASNGSLTITPAGGTGPYTYTLNPGNISITGAAGSTFSNLAPGTYTVTFSSNNGCNGVISPNPVVYARPPLTTSVAPTNPPCSGINDGIINITPNGGTGPFNFTLNPGNIVQSGAASTTFSGLPANTYSYSYTDAAGCVGSGTSTLTTNSAISSSSSDVMPLCNGASDGSLTVTPSGGVGPYQYSIDGGASYQSANTFSGLAAGNYTIRIRDFLNCLNDVPLSLNEPTILSASTDTLPSTCVGNDGTITITASGGTPGYSYSINNGNTYQAANSFTVPNGNFNDILVRDANNCVARTTAVVTRIDNMFLNVLPEDTTICFGSTATLRPETNAATSVFNWSSPDQDPGTIENASVKNARVTPNDTARYILHAFLGVCERKDTVLVRVLMKPVADAGADSAICFDQRVIYLSGNATNVSGPVSYSWSPSADLYTPNSQTSYGEIDNSSTFTLTVRDNYGCNFEVTDQVVMAKQPPVPAFAGKDTIAMTGQPHQLFASGGAGYIWTPAAPLDNPSSNAPIAVLQNDTRFIVLVSDVAGCIGSDTVFIKVYDGPAYYVPNAFSPNGDGLNDVFRPVPSGIVSTEYFRVFNRAGQVIFETRQWMKGWDGTFRGRLQSPGTYVWIVKGKDINGKTLESKGTVILIR